MRRYLILRHFINGEPTFEEFRAGIEGILAAIDLSKSREFGFLFGLKTTIDGKKGDDFQERIWEETRKLSTIRTLCDPVDRGPGVSYRQVLFNPSFSYRCDTSIVVNADLDQYVIDTEGALEQIVELTKKVERNGALYATGSRNVPVVLATHKRNSDLRILHELFHSLIIGSNKLRVDEGSQTATAAYAEIGESTSGLYVVNFSHPRYPELSKSMIDATQRADMSGFATDYYVAIKSAQLAHVANGYVQARENKFYEKRDESEEFAAVKRLISSQTQQLGKTDIRDVMLAGLRNRTHTERLSAFYPKEDVELVRGVMLEALE